VRRMIGLVVATVLLVPPGAVSGGGVESMPWVSPPTAETGYDDPVTVEIQLDRPPLAGETAPDLSPLLEVAFPTIAPAGLPEYEDVVFRVTLSGPVSAADTFGVAIECSKPCVTEDIWLVCTPPADFYVLPVCGEGTFEFTAQIEAGLVLDYALVRWTGDGPLRRHLHGSIVVHEGRQVISLGYVYPGGEAPGLPDTAVPAP